MVSRDGFVKILDFGLAKLVNRDSDQLPGAAALATSQALPGAVLGTIEYMSPEQANGLPLDFRSDQFSFGSVLYEMVTGKRSFQRRSKAETLAAILRDDLEPVVSLNPQAPAPLCWVIERCLAKDPKQRYTSTRDLVRDLATIRDRLSEAPSRHSPPRSSNLPAQRTVLIGRDQEVEAVKELLLRDDVHVVTLTGPGGIGKTRLGLQVAEEVAQSFPSGVFFVPLAAVSDTALVPSIIAQALGMRETGRQVTIESLKEYLQDLRTNLLLLFDNFEHLLAAARAAAELLTITPKLKILVTSRAPLHIYGEHEVPVPSLAVPDLRSAISLQSLSKNPAIALFLARAAAVKPNFQLTQENAVAVATICTRLDVLEGMASLVDKSLVQQIERPGAESRFVLLDTVREYGLERLAASGEEHATKRAHAAYCLVLAEESASQAADPARTEWVSLFEVENDNFRTALEWLTLTGNADWGLRLGAALFQFWDMREHLTAGRDRLGKLLKLEGATARLNTRARVLFAAGVLAGEQGDYAAACALVEESLDIARELNDSRGVGIALNALAVHARDRGDLAASRSLFEESLALWRSLGDAVVVARSLSNLANVVKLQGDYGLARSLYEECLSTFRELGDRTGIAWSLNYEGDVAHEQGDDAGARALYEQSLTVFKELGDKWGIAGCLIDLGNLARDHRDYETSRSQYAKSMKLFQELGQKRGIARLLDCLACSAALQCKPERALRLAEAAAAMRRILGAPLPLNEQARSEKTLELARESLSPTVSAAAWMDGWTTPPDKAVRDALTDE